MLLSAAILIWQIFHPALMSPDSIAQYAQAKAGKFDDWRPPLMAIVLSGVMRVGGDLGGLMLLQCFAGLLGPRTLILLAGELCSPQLSPRFRQWVATFAALLFLLPITPLSFYLMTFWKDSWLAIVFLWGAAYLIWLFVGAKTLTESHFIFGDAYPLVWSEKPIVKPAYIRLDADNPEIDREYRNLLFGHTGLWAKVKVRSFAALLDPRDAPKGWYYTRLDSNVFGLRLNEHFAGLRKALFWLGWRVWRHRLLRWASGVHLVWLMASLAAVLAAFRKAWSHRKPRAMFLPG
ncbi:MAG: hypothetical protein ACREEM_39010 [Blastocatellia bacterium]